MQGLPEGMTHNVCQTTWLVWSICSSQSRYCMTSLTRDMKLRLSTLSTWRSAESTEGGRGRVIAVIIINTWVVNLKDKKGVSIANTFRKVLYKSGRKPYKIWVHKESDFYNASVKNGWKIMILKCIQYITKENLLLQKDLLQR